MMGAEFAAAAPGDGYNQFFTVKGVMAIAPHLYQNARYNALKDFKAISQILVVPHIITATPNAPCNNLKEMVEYAKKNPGKINYASAGVGSQPHVALEARAKRMGIQLNHIPYKSNPGPDVMSGVVEIYLEASASAIPSIQSGKIKALAVSGNEPEIQARLRFLELLTMRLIRDIEEAAGQALQDGYGRGHWLVLTRHVPRRRTSLC